MIVYIYCLSCQFSLFKFNDLSYSFYVLFLEHFVFYSNLKRHFYIRTHYIYIYILLCVCMIMSNIAIRTSCNFHLHSLLFLKYHQFIECRNFLHFANYACEKFFEFIIKPSRRDCECINVTRI